MQNQNLKRAFVLLALSTLPAISPAEARLVDAELRDLVESVEAASEPNDQAMLDMEEDAFSNPGPSPTTSGEEFVAVATPSLTPVPTASPTASPTVGPGGTPTPSPTVCESESWSSLLQQDAEVSRQADRRLTRYLQERALVGENAGALSELDSQMQSAAEAALQQVQSVQNRISSDLAQGKAPQGPDPFSAKNCGNCDNPHCSSVKVVCDDLQIPLFVEALCYQRECKIILKEETCELIGNPTKLSPKPGSGDELKMPEIEDVQGALAYCSAKHEMTHTCDSPDTCQLCATEVSAFQKSISCLDQFFSQKCAFLFPSWDRDSCRILRYSIESQKKALALNQCLCGKDKAGEQWRVPGTPGTYRPGACRSCAAKSKLDLSRPSDRHIHEAYCEGREQGEER